MEAARGSYFNQCKEKQSATQDRSLFETHLGPADMRIHTLIIL